MTTKKRINESLQGMKTVFSLPRYFFLAIFIAVIVLVFAIWLPNLSLMFKIIVSFDYSLAQKSTILFSSLGAINTNFTTVNRAVTIAMAILSGANISMLVYYLRHRFRLERSAGTSVVGVVIGMLGVGCASCGSVILASFLGVGTATGFLGALPFHGSEIGFIGLLVLIYANYSVGMKIISPSVCSTHKHRITDPKTRIRA